MRRSGGAVLPATKATTGLVTLWAMKAAASSSSDPPISPIRAMASVCGSSSKRVRMSMNVVPMIGSPPMPTQVDWPTPRSVRAPAIS